MHIKFNPAVIQKASNNWQSVTKVNFINDICRKENRRVGIIILTGEP